LIEVGKANKLNRLVNIGQCPKGRSNSVDIPSCIGSSLSRWKPTVVEMENQLCEEGYVKKSGKEIE
jgi:hypothetical protein